MGYISLALPNIIDVYTLTINNNSIKMKFQVIWDIAMRRQTDTKENIRDKEKGKTKQKHSNNTNPYVHAVYIAH